MSQEAEVTSSEGVVRWFAIPEQDMTTLADYNNESWLDWPPWNMTESDWTEWQITDDDVSLYWLGFMISLPVVLTVLYVTYLHVIRVRQNRTWHYGVSHAVEGPYCRPCCPDRYPDACSALLCNTRSTSSDLVRLSEEGTLYSGDAGTCTDGEQLSEGGYQTVKIPAFRKHSEYSVRYEQLHCDPDDTPDTTETLHGDDLDIRAEHCFASPDT